MGDDVPSDRLWPLLQYQRHTDSAATAPHPQAASLFDADDQTPSGASIPVEAAKEEDSQANPFKSLSSGKADKGDTNTDEDAGEFAHV